MITKTVYQPIGSLMSGKAVGNELDVGACSGLFPGDFVSIGCGNICAVDRLKSLDGSGIAIVSGSYRGAVTVQKLANLSGCWLELEVTPPSPISVGLICATPKGVLLDRNFPECALGRELSVNGKTLGSILGATVLSDGRSVISVSNPIAIEGVGVASVGGLTKVKGQRIGDSPFVTIAAELPIVGDLKLSLKQGWRSRKACIPDMVSYSKILCQGSIG